MSTCGSCASCAEAAGVSKSSALFHGSKIKRKTIALAGNPNSGKTTIFNALTGMRQKVANYPGATVEKKLGLCRLPDGSDVQIIDLPGTYSLISRAPDERVSMEVLRGIRADTPRPYAVILVLDASNLQRNLYLASQLIEAELPMVVALNMMDVAERRGISVSPKRLGELLQVPVIPLVGHKRSGIAALKASLSEPAAARVPEWQLPSKLRTEVAEIGRMLASSSCVPVDSLRPPPYENLAERLLVGDEAADLIPLSSHPQIATALAASKARLSEAGVDAMASDIEAHYRWIEQTAESARADPLERKETISFSKSEAREHFSEKVDRVLVHRFWGLLIFAAIMGGLFLCMFSLSAPIQGWLQDSLGSLGAYIASYLPEGAPRSLVQDGIFAGVGAVAVFIPQIAILFLFLAVLEDSGYMARAAFLMDRLLSRVGLHGKSFIPLLSGFACAIPGIMATRTIEDRRDRLATILVLPFMTCSARLPVYGLMIGTFFASHTALARAGVMLLLYMLGIVAAAGVAWLFRCTLLRGPGHGFILELPTYKVPQVSLVARQIWWNSSKFLTKAGTTIFLISVCLWFMSYYPRLPDPAAETAGYKTQSELSSAQQRYSYAGRLGHAIEPIIRPLGFDWKIGIAGIGAFAAREVFVSTLAVVYGTGNSDEETSSLADALQKDRYPDGRPVWTPLVAANVLLWFVLAMQCLSTVTVVRQEAGGWKWALVLLVYMNALAYLSCLALYQIGSVFL